MGGTRTSTSLLALLVAAAVAVATPGPVASASFMDDFEDGVFDPAWVPSGSCALPVETGGQARLEKPSPCVGGMALELDRTAFPLRGDFVVSVDFEFASFSVPGTGDRVAGLQVRRVGGEFVGVIERYNRQLGACNPSTETYKAWTSTSANCSPEVVWLPTTDASGKFRVTRTGSTLTLSYWNAGWQTLKTDSVTGEDLYVVLNAVSLNGDSGSFDVRYDSFMVTGPPGACCFGDVCIAALEAACGQNGGVYLGDSTPCDPSPCEGAPLGACRFGDLCTATTRCQCETNGGIYDGDGSDCTTSGVASPSGMESGVGAFLRDLRPNPAYGEVELSVSLPGPGSVIVETFDVAGRAVGTPTTHEVAGGVGTIVRRLEDSQGRPLHDGVYFLRLTHEGSTQARGVVVRR